MIDHGGLPDPDEWGDVTVSDTFRAMAQDVAATRHMVERLVESHATVRRWAASAVAVGAAAMVVAVVAFLR